MAIRAALFFQASVEFGLLPLFAPTTRFVSCLAHGEPCYLSFI